MDPLFRALSKREGLRRSRASDPKKFVRDGGRIRGDAELIADVYDFAELERAWRAHVVRSARDAGSIKEASWYRSGDRVIGLSQTEGSGIWLPPTWGQEEMLTFLLARPLCSEQSAGFVVGYRGEDDYVVIKIDTTRRRVGFIQRQNGRWRSWDYYALPSKFDPTTERVALRVNDSGLLQVTRGGRSIAEHRFPPGAIVGRRGLFTERSHGDGEPQCDGRVIFADADAR